MKSKYSYDNVLPDYIINNHDGEKRTKRKCFHCGKETLMTKFQRWCSAHCKYMATQDCDGQAQEDFKVRT